MNKLVIGGREFNSRLFVGTGKFSSNPLMEKAIIASGSEMVTVAMKRVDMIIYNYFRIHRESVMQRRQYLLHN